MKKKSIGLNAVLNVIRQGLSVLFPLITYPYALRILGAEGIGMVNYSRSIVKYFALLSLLGINVYAVREGAKIRENREKFSLFINEMFSIHFLSTCVSYVILFISIFTIGNIASYRELILIESISILLTTLSVDYVVTIYEEYLLVTIRSIITHIVTLILLFVIVKTPNDYYKYVTLNVITNAIICISNIFYYRKKISIRFTWHLNLQTHLKPILTLFANALAVSIYVNVDTTMLGWIKGDLAVGYYSAAVSVYTILKNILAAIYIVAVPRLSSYIGANDKDRYKKLSTDLFCYLMLILIPAGVGVVCLSPEIMLFMGGRGYTESIYSMRILGGSLVFAIFGGYVTSCLNITLGREKENLIATFISALLNVGLNILIIPMLSHYGAAITTLISEAFVFVFCYIRIPNKKLILDVRVVRITLVHSCIGILVVLVTTYIGNAFVSNYLLRTIFIVFSTLIGYYSALALLKDEYIKKLIIASKDFVLRRQGR